MKRTSVVSFIITNYTKRSSSKIDHVRKVGLHAAFQSRYDRETIDGMYLGLVCTVPMLNTSISVEILLSTYK